MASAKATAVTCIRMLQYSGLRQSRQPYLHSFVHPGKFVSQLGSRNGGNRQDAPTVNSTFLMSNFFNEQTNQI